MTPKQTYELYLAIKLHFTSDYNFQKYRGKLPAKVVDSLSKKGMRYSVEGLSKHKDLKGFLLANIIYDPDWTPFKYRDDRSKRIYLEWKRRTDALLYNFEQDLTKLVQPFKNNFICINGPPSLLLTHVAGLIGAETVAILLDLTKLGKFWCDELQKSEHPYCQVAFRLNKYSAFLDYDKEVYSLSTNKISEGRSIGWTFLEQSA